MINKNKKIYMWYKVKELREKGLNKSQISTETQLDRATVRKYLQMTENEFHNWISTSKNLPLKLSKYLPFVKKELEACQYLSAAQIEDRLKENFTDLPDFHSKTVYNFTELVRRKYNIPKPKKKDARVFEKLPELPYGQQAQVDFGQTFMQTSEGKRRKIYFFAMVLSRSRQKFFYLDNKPFTTVSSIHAHNLAFEYFEGVPKEILYDQDSVFIHDENLGDYLLTNKFKKYCNSQDFKTIFCRKADPQSKGKVENVVKFIKQNFLRGRKFADIEMLNKDAILWLKRTGNGKRHSGTQKIPFEEWCNEKKYLLPLKSKTKKEYQNLKKYKVRKDNTIIYKSNHYSLPAGTYKNKETSIFLEIKQDSLYLYSIENEHLATHKISLNKGEYIRNTDHRREKSKTTAEFEKQAFEILQKTEISEEFIALLKKKKSRYYRDNLQYIIKKINCTSEKIITESILFCIENKQFNSNVLCQIIEKKKLEIEQKQQADKFIKTEIDVAEKIPEISESKISKSNINDYEKLF